jgi:hypothetical protein
MRKSNLTAITVIIEKNLILILIKILLLYIYTIPFRTPLIIASNGLYLGSLTILFKIKKAAALESLIFFYFMIQNTMNIISTYILIDLFYLVIMFFSL